VLLFQYCLQSFTVHVLLFRNREVGIERVLDSGGVNMDTVFREIGHAHSRRIFWPFYLISGTFITYLVLGCSFLFLCPFSRRQNTWNHLVHVLVFLVES